MPTAKRIFAICSYRLPGPLGVRSSPTARRPGDGRVVECGSRCVASPNESFVCSARGCWNVWTLLSQSIDGTFRAFKDFQNKTDAPAVDSVVDAATMLSEEKQWIAPRGSAVK